MKRLMALVIAVMFVLLLAGTVYAADITVSVTMTGYSLRVTGTTWSILGLTPSLDTAKQTTTYVINDGGVMMDVTLLCGNSTNWFLKTTGDATGKDSFLMRAIFSWKDTTIAFAGANADSFESGDAITGGAQEGTNALFYATNCGSGATADGLAIASNDSVRLWLWFKAPTTSSTVAQQDIGVTVGGKNKDP